MPHPRRLAHAALVATSAALVACSAPATTGAAPQPAAADDGSHAETPLAQAPFTPVEVARFNEPWAMAFLPGTPFALITEKSGKLKLWQADGPVRDVAGVPDVAYGGQGGLGDVITVGAAGEHGTQTIALSWAEAGPDNTFGAVVALADINPNVAAPRLDNLRIVWRQTPKVTGRGHYSHRIAVSPDGRYLFIGSGERQKFDPAQDMTGNLGKIVRLNLDGTPAAGNPFADQPGVAKEVWTLGHRNILGMAFDAAGQLWAQEMGPAGGDEVNRIVAGRNYGYPIGSNGDHYDGKDIPDPPTRPEFAAPAAWWNPSISPGGLIVVRGTRYPRWQGSLLLGGLSGMALIRVIPDGEGARKAERWSMGDRIREVEEGPDGTIWLLTDGKDGRLLRLNPRS